MSESTPRNELGRPIQNTDIEIWRERPGDSYAANCCVARSNKY